MACAFSKVRSDISTPSTLLHLRMKRQTASITLATCVLVIAGFYLATWGDSSLECKTSTGVSEMPELQPTPTTSKPFETFEPGYMPSSSVPVGP